MPIAVFGAAPKPEADADAVHESVVEAREQLKITMRTIRLSVPEAIQAKRDLHCELS